MQEQFVSGNYANNFRCLDMVKSPKKQDKKTLLENRPEWAERFETALHLISRDKVKLGEIFSVHWKTVESWMMGRTEPAFQKLLLARERSGCSLEWILAGVGSPHLANSAAPSLERGGAADDDLAAEAEKLAEMPREGARPLQSRDQPEPPTPVHRRARQADRIAKKPLS